MQDTDRRAVKMGLGAVMLWSTVATAFSLSLQYLAPLQLVTLATAVSWCFFAIRLSSSERWQAMRATSPKARATGLLVGWLNPGLYYLVLFAAYDRLPAQEAMAINYSWGITLALLAAPLLRQRLSSGALLAACISYGGIVVIATRGAPLSLDFAQPLGVGLALLSTLLWSLYWVINTRLSLDPEVNLFLNFSGALPLLLALLWLSDTPFPTVWQGWAGGLYVGLFEMGIAFVLDGRDESDHLHLADFQPDLFIAPAVAGADLGDRWGASQSHYADRLNADPLRALAAASGRILNSLPVRAGSLLAPREQLRPAHHDQAVVWPCCAPHR